MTEIEWDLYFEMTPEEQVRYLRAVEMVGGIKYRVTLDRAAQSPRSRKGAISEAISMREPRE